MRKYLLVTASTRAESIDQLKRFARFMHHFQVFAEYAWLEVGILSGSKNWGLSLVRKSSSFAFEGDFHKSLMLAEALDEATKAH